MSTQTTTYFWVIGLQAVTPHGVRAIHDSGLVTIEPGMTRAGIYNEVLAKLLAALQITPDQSVVTFWSLEPNGL
ncbi:hypothetical protein ACH4KV_24240 [Streptomyces albidoflavus]